MSAPNNPDPNLTVAYTLTIAAMAVKLRNIDLNIVDKPGILDEENRLKMLEALARTDAASQHLRETLMRAEDKPQQWGPCPKCSGDYRFETLGPYGMDAFKITKIVCNKCGYTVNWHNDPNGDASAAWQRERHKAASDKMGEKMEKLKAMGEPTDEEVETQMRSSAEFKKQQDERDRKG